MTGAENARDLINALAENLTYEDIIRAEEYSKGYVEGFQDGLEADRPQGEWIEVDDYFIRCKCSICGWESHKYEDDVYGMPYCPNCGKRMKETK